MAVEKMHFSMPMAAGLEGFPFTPFAVEARADLEAFTVEARAEQQAPITVKGKVKKAKAKGKVEKAKPEIKVKAEKAKPEAKAKVEKAKTEVKKAKTEVKKAKPEVKAKVEKANVEVETITTEEGLIKFMELLEKEAAFLKAKAEAEEAAGYGSKRKPVLERDEELAAFVARMESLRPLYGEEDVSDGYNSQDDG